MYLKGVSASPEDFVVFTYSIINKGHGDPGVVEKSTRKLVEDLAKKGVELATTAGSAAIGAALGAAIGTAGH